MTETKMIIARIPPSLHKAVRLKGIRVNKTMTQIVEEKLAEWVNEPDQTPESPKLAKTQRAKVTA